MDKPNEASLPALCKVREAAMKLNSSESLVRRLIAKGLLGSFRIGRKIFVTDEHIAAFLRTNERHPML